MNIYRHAVLSIILAALFLIPTIAVAADTGLPWETPLETLLESITGPVAQAAAIIAITFFGLVLAFGGGGGGLRTAVGILFGISIAFAATSFFTDFFNFAGGMVVF